MSPEAREVLEYWFGTAELWAEPAAEKQKLWWGGSPALDEEIRENFGALHAQAVAGELDGWTESLEGRLALIVLLDQLSRNIHRGEAGAFAGDDAAQRLALDAIDRGEDERLGMQQRTFLYMPLEHAENLDLQERCVALFEAMTASLPPSMRETGAYFAQFARKHRDIIARFGRFPYRNEALGRESTPEEEAWLAESPETFGQGKKKA